MDESIRTAAISPLRQRLIDDMNMRRFSRETQRNYIRDMGRFATFLRRSPDTATATASSFRKWQQGALGICLLVAPALASLVPSATRSRGAPAGPWRTIAHAPYVFH